MLDRLKALPLTIALTILIWMYAEAEFTSTQDGVPMKVQILSLDPNQFSVRAIDENGAGLRNLDLTLTVQGAKGEIDKILQQSRSPRGGGGGVALSPQPILLDPATIPAKGRFVSLVPLLNEMEFFQSRGLRVQSCTPERVWVDSDKLVHFSRTLQSNAFRPGGVPVTVERFDPPTVDVTLPEKLLTSLGGDSAISLIAEPQGRLTENVGTLRAVPVRIVAEKKGESLANLDDRISITPQEVTCYLTVKAQLYNRFTTARPIPILVTGTTDVLSPYRIEMNPKEVTVTVTGTVETIANLKAAMAAGSSAATEEQIRAYLDLTNDDKPTPGYVTRRIRYALPEGVSLDSKVEKVEFRLTEAGNGTATRP